MKIFSWLGLLIALGLILFAMGVGGWHLYRYELAPRLGLLDEAEIWAESIETVNSPFRLLEEKSAALDQLLSMQNFSSSLSGAARLEISDAMQNIIFREDYPLDLKYKSAQVKTMISGKKPLKTSFRSIKKSANRPTIDQQILDLDHTIKTLQAMATLSRDELRRTSPKRTRLFVAQLRQTPCAHQLVQFLEKFSERDDLPPVERSFLFGVLGQQPQKCAEHRIKTNNPQP